MADLKLSVRTSQFRYAFGETVDLIVQIKNTSKRKLHVIAEPRYIWKAGHDRVKVLFAETETAEGLAYYNYIPPRLRSLSAGGTMTIKAPIGMPPREGEIDSRGRYVWRETPVGGNVFIEVAVGYLREPFRPASSAPWAEFLARQKRTAPARAKVFLEPA